MNIVQLNNIFKKAAEAQPTVHSFTTQDVYEYWNTDEVKYGSVAFVVTSTSISGGVNQYSAVLYYADRLNEDKSNRDNIKSDAVNTIQAIIGVLNRNIDDLDITYPSRIELFEQKFVDELAGGYVNISITAEGVSECGYDADVDFRCSFKAQDKEVTINRNGETVVYPDTGYMGIGRAVIHTNVPTVVKNQSKTIDINSNGQSIVTYDDAEYSGLEDVTINVDVPVKLQDKIVEITENGIESVTYDDGFDGLSNVTINTNVKTKVQEKIEVITENKSINILPDEGFEGMNKVSITVDVPPFDAEPGYLDASYMTELSPYRTFKLSDAIKRVSLPLDLISSASSLYEAFYNCKSLTNIPPLTLPYVSNLDRCFYGCSSLSNATLAELSNVRSMSSCFYVCENINNITFRTNAPHNVMNNLVNINSCFFGCKSLTRLDLPYMPNVNNIDVCFANCENITVINGVSDIGVLARNLDSYIGVFRNCKKLQSVQSFNILNVTNMDDCFENCESITNIYLGALNKINSISDCFNGCIALETLRFAAISSTIKTLTNWGISTCTALTKNSLINILNALPNISGHKTCSLGTTNLSKLTAEEIQIGTDKGWIIN